MRKPAIIHIGFPKSGSSSVQKTFALNRRVLSKAGWHYARFTQFGRDAVNHSTPLINLLAQHSNELKINLKVGANRAEQVAKFRAELEQNLACDLPLIFSGENICGMGVPALKALKAAFDDAGRDIRIIGFIRPPTEYCESLVQQLVKDGAVDLGLRCPLEKYLSHRVRRVRQVFPDAEFYPFDRVKADAGGPPGFLADLIEPGLSARLTQHRVNASVSANAVELLRHLNRVLPVFPDGDAPQINPLRLHGDARPLFRLSGERFRLRPPDMAVIAEQIAEQNTWLERHLGAEFCDQKEPPAADPLIWRAQQAGELRAILRWMPKHMRIAIADYFANRSDLPPELQALAGRYRAGGNLVLRYKRGGPGIGVLEQIYRRLHRQW